MGITQSYYGRTIHGTVLSWLLPGGTEENAKSSLMIASLQVEMLIANCDVPRQTIFQGVN
jgi:hypothetical protein